jgi:peptidoglycan hydrolase-like protein with peptidoglycan-binding domain
LILTAKTLFPVLQQLDITALFRIPQITLNDFGIHFAAFHAWVRQNIQKEYLMKTRKSVLAGIFVAGSLALAPTLSPAQDMQRHDSRKSIEDDSSLPPNIPGVTDDHGSGFNMSRDDVQQMEYALADAGYDPGAIDGVIDDQTRAAISEFQSDHTLAATGIFDAATGELLGIVISQSS